MQPAISRVALSYKGKKTTISCVAPCVAYGPQIIPSQEIDAPSEHERSVLYDAVKYIGGVLLGFAFLALIYFMASAACIGMHGADACFR